MNMVTSGLLAFNMTGVREVIKVFRVIITNYQITDKSFATYLIVEDIILNKIINNNFIDFYKKLDKNLIKNSNFCKNITINNKYLYIYSTCTNYFIMNLLILNKFN